MNDNVFDPTTLSAEALAWVEAQKTAEADRRVTGAVITAKQKAKAELEQELRETLKKELEEQAKLSVEEKLKLERTAIESERNALKKESNSFLVKKELIASGFDEASIDRLTPLIVSEDKDSTVSKLNEFKDVYTSTLTARVEKEKLALLGNAGKTPPGGNGTPPSEEAEYKAQFKKAKDTNDTQLASRLIREAQTKGINIF